MRFALKITLLVGLTRTCLLVVNGEECFVGKSSSSDRNKWQWNLTPEDPCRCTRLIRQEDTKAVVISDDIHVIRSFLKVTCKTSDAKAPTFTFCPANQTMEVSPGQSTVIVEWNNPVATDNSGHKTTVTCNAESGSKFQIGQTKVACEARDIIGNVASCGFTINITDGEAPKFIFCPANQTMEANPGKSTALVNWLNPEATDNSGHDITVTCNAQSGSAYEIGQTEVACEARDVSGNKATCTFTAKITDAEAPTFIFCPTNQTIEACSGQSTAIVEWDRPVATDNSGHNTIVTCNAWSGSKFEIGHITVACEARDTSGNLASCSFTINIIDAEAPAFISCPANQTLMANPVESTATVLWSNPEVTDNSGGTSTLICNAESGSKFEIGRTEVVYEAWDASGNEATCLFTVTITDAEAPAIFCPANQTIVSLGDSTVMVLWSYPEATDNSRDNITVTCNAESGSRFVIGKRGVVCEALDASGNEATCMFSVNIIECPQPHPLGMENNLISNAQITVSSTNSNTQTKDKSRLNNDLFWMPYLGRANNWIRIDLLSAHIVTGVITQGGTESAFNFWTKTYYVQYAQTTTERFYIRDGAGNNKLFSANTNTYTPVTNVFESPVIAIAIQVEPTDCTTFNNYGVACGLRLEILGCKID